MKLEKSAFKLEISIYKLKPCILKTGMFTSHLQISGFILEIPTFLI